MSERVLLAIIAGLVLVVGVLVGLLVGGGDDDAPTVAPAESAASTTTAPADETATTSEAPATTEPPSTTSTTSTTTTEAAEPASGVIVAGAGVAGWSEDGAWVTLDDGEAPAVVGETYQVVQVGEPTRTATATAVETGCEFVEGSRNVDGLMGADDWPDFPLAIAADWDVVPHPIEMLSTESEIYIDIVADVLVGQGVIDPAPELRQVIRTDLEGDGVDEVIVIAGHDGLFGAGGAVAAGDYSIAILRRLIEGEVQTAILGFFTVGDDFDPTTDAPYIVVYRVAAVADLNGDGRMEIAVNDRYYEGSGTIVYDYVNDDLGPVPVLNVGCGV